MDIAYAVHYVELATPTNVRSISHKWAGRRTFSEDRIPVIGFADDVPGILWLAGQGGSGVQASPALGEAQPPC